MTAYYRNAVGIMLLNEDGLIWTGRRSPHITAAAHLYEDKHLWQMPQGGIDDGENVLAAARRELHEETGITHIEVVAESNDWLQYDLPENLIGKALKGFCGQRLKWFAMRFLGNADEINLNAHWPAEFTEWRWRNMEDILEHVIPFKTELYQKVFAEFRAFLK